MTYLADILQAVEAKYAPSYREVQGNRLVRRWRVDDNEDENDPYVLGVAGHRNRWYTRLSVGEPPQSLEFELDMLGPDFYTIVTTSDRGTTYNASASRSHVPIFSPKSQQRTPLVTKKNQTQALKNQPILLDINVPFILAPPVATQRFYESIGGTKRLPAPYDSFFAFPCLNPVNIAFEIGGWNFPTMNGEGTSSDALYGPSGGRFSLGKLADGTGYCVGSVVESRMGMHKEWSGSGLRDVWVLGEPFFRGLGVAFDVELGRVGVRTY